MVIDNDIRFALTIRLPNTGEKGFSDRRRRNIPSRLVTFVACAALVLASCTDYKARLRPPDEPRTDAIPGLVPPQAETETRSIWHGEKISGWVHLRFDVSEKGEAGNVEVIESSDTELEVRATEALAAWPFEPAARDGVPEAFEDMEVVMAFYTDDTTTTAEAVGITALVIILIPLALIGAFAGGELKFGK